MSTAVRGPTGQNQDRFLRRTHASAQIRSVFTWITLRYRPLNIQAVSNPSNLNSRINSRYTLLLIQDPEQSSEKGHHFKAFRHMKTKTGRTSR